MINKHFRRNLLLQRFTGAKGWLAFLIGIATIALCLIALPFLLLFGAITFVLLSVFGRLFLKRKMAQFQAAGFNHNEQSSFSQQDFYEPPSQNAQFKTKPKVGRTFEHDPD